MPAITENDTHEVRDIRYEVQEIIDLAEDDADQVGIAQIILDIVNAKVEEATTEGYNRGYDDGRLEGEDEGYDAGYDAGIEDATCNDCE